MGKSGVSGESWETVLSSVSQNTHRAQHNIYNQITSSFFISLLLIYYHYLTATPGAKGVLRHANTHAVS